MRIVLNSGPVRKELPARRHSLRKALERWKAQDRVLRERLERTEKLSPPISQTNS